MDTEVLETLPVLPAHLDTVRPCGADPLVCPESPHPEWTSQTVSMGSFPRPCRRAPNSAHLALQRDGLLPGVALPRTEKRPLHSVRRAVCVLPSCGLERRGLAIPETRQERVGILT